MRSFSFLSPFPRSVFPSPVALLSILSVSAGVFACASGSDATDGDDTGLTSPNGTDSASSGSSNPMTQPPPSPEATGNPATPSPTPVSGGPTGATGPTGPTGASGPSGPTGSMPTAGGGGAPSIPGAAGASGGGGDTPAPAGSGGSGPTPVETNGGAAGESAGGGGSAGESNGGAAPTGDASIWDFVEDPGAACSVGAIPTPDSLTADPKLPNPFIKLDGSEMTDKSEWLCRREEILQVGYEYIYGEKPRTPKEAVSGTVSNSSISVEVSDGGSTQFSVTVTLPSSGSAPYPAVIGFGGIGFSSELGSRGIASINYSAYTVGAENGGSGPKEGGFYDVYGSDHKAGLLVAWAWGISRIIDVLEQDPSVIDPTRIGVTGCSRFGKGAFVTGVLDNRIALTIPVESGVGGTPALRLIGDLDSGGEWPYHAISYERWFSAENLGRFATANNANGDTTDKLPVDIHEMIGLVAPRGLYIVDNPSTNYAGLDRNAAWVTANAGRTIYEALGVGENFTLQGASGSHCQWRSQYTAPLVANLEKFLLGDDSAQTGSVETDFNGPNPESHYDWTPPTLAGEL